MARKSSGGSSAAKSSSDETTGGIPSSRDLEAVAEQLEVLRRDVSTLVDTLGDLVGNTAREGRATVERKADEYIRRGRRQADEAVSQARAWEEELETQIGRNPLTAILVALGLGFLIGLISRR